MKTHRNYLLKAMDEPACQYWTICRNYIRNRCYQSTPCDIKGYYEGEVLEEVVAELNDLSLARN